MPQTEWLPRPGQTANVLSPMDHWDYLIVEKHEACWLYGNQQLSEWFNEEEVLSLADRDGWELTAARLSFSGLPMLYFKKLRN
jgi:hypothetical protein